MCIVVDANTFASVFDSGSKQHPQFKPVLDWIVSGRGKIVFGGTTYFAELKKAAKFIGVLGEFKRQGKVCRISDKEVDAEEIKVAKLVRHKDFDDQHIVAILRTSACMLVCSGDKRAFPFFRHQTLFPNRTSRPRIYSNRSSAKLLADKNIAECCKPAVRLNRKNKGDLTVAICGALDTEKSGPNDRV